MEKPLRNRGCPELDTRDVLRVIFEVVQVILVTTTFKKAACERCFDRNYQLWTRESLRRDSQVAKSLVVTSVLALVRLH